MRIGIIGAGKVGTTLGKYLSIHGKNVTGFYSRTHESADEAATTEEVEEDTTTVVRPREIPIKKKGNPQPVTP